MWTVEKERHFAEPAPEVKAQARSKFREWSVTGEWRLIEEAKELCGPQGREWFEAMLVEFQAVSNVPAPSGKAGPAPATSSGVGLAEVAPLATPEGTHSASPSTGAGASPSYGHTKRRGLGQRQRERK
jgi:hypothetical protein